jgi:glycosidase
MLYFLENHDEQRIASDFFAGSGKKGVPAMIASVLMQKNPFMLYAGEEYGERGMDKEGFSGQDGRTTIFDYWSIDTLCRAAAKKLTAEEKALYDIHKKALQMARKEKTIGEGAFFDLMYVNGHLLRQYAFLRKAGSEVLLVVVNFDELPMITTVNIPGHAFDYLMMKEKNAVATDLLSGQKVRLSLKRDGGIPVSLEPLGAVVLKFKD